MKFTLNFHISPSPISPRPADKVTVPALYLTEVCQPGTLILNLEINCS